MIRINKNWRQLNKIKRKKYNNYLNKSKLKKEKFICKNKKYQICKIKYKKIIPIMKIFYNKKMKLFLKAKFKIKN